MRMSDHNEIRRQRLQADWDSKTEEEKKKIKNEINKSTTSRVIESKVAHTPFVPRFVRAED